MSEKAIKSVRRVFEILEFFDQERRPLTANEVARQLGYPLTSAHALLKSMHELDYAEYDPATWAYTPARRLSAMVNWVNEFLDHEPQLLDFMADLNQASRETVNLSRRIGTRAKIIHGLESLHAVGVSVQIGTVMPVNRSLTGITLLSGMPASDRKALLERLARDDSETDNEALASMYSELETRGTVCRCDQYIQGIGAVCLPVKLSTWNETIVIGVVGPSDRIRTHAEEHRRLLKTLTEKHGVNTLFKLKKPKK